MRITVLMVLKLQIYSKTRKKIRFSIFQKGTILCTFQQGDSAVAAVATVVAEAREVADAALCCLVPH